MVTNPPPARFRVVERGRRLEVVDSWAGQRPPDITSPTPSRDAPPSLIPAKASFDGRAEFTTHPLYDDKAPRRIKLASAPNVGVLVAICATVIAALLFVPGLLIAAPVMMWASRKKLRGAITAWLDRQEQG